MLRRVWACSSEKENREHLRREDAQERGKRIAEMSDDNPGEKHAGGAQADAAEFQTAQRHSEHTDKGERADRVRDRLRLVQLEEPVMPQATGAAAFTSALAPAA